MSKTHKFYDIKQRLSDLRDTRDTINRTLKNLEKQIYAFEGTYLEETNLYENVTKGWDRYVINNRGKKSVMKSIREFDDKERLFSKSSVTSTKAVLDPENKIRDIPSSGKRKSRLPFRSPSDLNRISFT